MKCCNCNSTNTIGKGKPEGTIIRCVDCNEILRTRDGRLTNPACLQTFKKSDIKPSVTTNYVHVEETCNSECGRRMKYPISCNNKKCTHSPDYGKEEPVITITTNISTSTDVKVGYIKRKQDYAKELFELSRPTPCEVDSRETEKICICERAWCGDVASYIAELENEVLRLHKEEE